MNQHESFKGNQHRGGSRQIGDNQTGRRSERRRQAKLIGIEAEAVEAVTATMTGAAHMLALTGLVGALAERGLVEPAKVVDWVESMAVGFDYPDTAMRDGVLMQIAAFTQMIRSMKSIPPNAGRG